MIFSQGILSWLAGRCLIWVLFLGEPGAGGLIAPSLLLLLAQAGCYLLHVSCILYCCLDFHRRLCTLCVDSGGLPLKPLLRIMHQSQLHPVCTSESTKLKLRLPPLIRLVGI